MDFHGLKNSDAVFQMLNRCHNQALLKQQAVCEVTLGYQLYCWVFVNVCGNSLEETMASFHQLHAQSGNWKRAMAREFLILFFGNAGRKMEQGNTRSAKRIGNVFRP